MSQDNVSQFDRGQGQQRDYGPVAKVFGSKSALTVQCDKTASGELPTIQIDAAKSIGERKYDWNNKLVFQNTVAELPQCLSVLLGVTKKVELKNHGPEKNKTLSIEFQGDKVFWKMQGKDHFHTIPITPADTFRLTSLYIRQIQANNPWLRTATDVIMMIKHMPKAQ